MWLDRYITSNGKYENYTPQKFQLFDNDEVFNGERIFA